MLTTPSKDKDALGYGRTSFINDRLVATLFILLLIGGLGWKNFRSL